MVASRRPPSPIRPPSGFNPLHCGAVVASSGGGARGDAWPGCFNPLHCGAVVASDKQGKIWVLNPFVSIPFIAGQWSLQAGGGNALKSPSMFQSPSLRGSGRFGKPQSGDARRSDRFNPLHCGAVVASKIQKVRGDAEALVSIPFIAGQWSLRTDGGSSSVMSRGVSIPFIAGQWSLRGGQGAEGRRAPCFNPLHCGAVVASRPPCCCRGGRGISFQSPSLRGSGRFGAPGRGAGHGDLPVSIPFIAGQWSLRCFPRRYERRELVSIPFIAGQWSLLPRTTPLSFCGVWLRKGRPLCDHVLCTRLHVWPKPVILP